MADSAQTLELLIKLGVIGQDDAKAAQQLLNETRDAADPAAESFGNLAKQTGHAAEGMRMAHGEMREVHRVMGEINRLAPGTGELLRGMMNPEMMGLGVAIVAFEAIHGLIKKISEQAAEFKKQMADAAAAALDLQAAMDAEAIKESADAIKTYGENVNEAAAALEHQKAAEDAVLAVMGEKAKQEQDMMSAEEKDALARIDNSKLSSQEKEREKKKIEERFAASKTEAADEADARKLRQEEADIAGRTKNQPYLQGQADEAGRGANWLRVRADAAEADLKMKQEQADKAQKGLADVLGSPDSSPEQRAHAQAAFAANEEIVRQAKVAAAAAERDAKAGEALANQRAAALNANAEAINKETELVHQGIAVLEARIKGQQAIAQYQGEGGLAAALNKLFSQVEDLQKQLTNIGSGHP